MTLTSRASADDLPPQPPVRGADRTVWVGLFLVLGLVSALLALLVLTDAAIFRGRYIVSTRVSDAGGIRKGDPVQMRGVNVGRIQGFGIGQDGVEVRLEIEGEYGIPRDSRVELKSAGLLGGLVADVVPGTSKENVSYGDTLPGSSGEGLMEATDRIAEQAETVLARMEEMLSPQTVGNVRGSAEDLRKLLGQLSSAVDEERRKLATLTASLQRSSEGLERVTTGPELTRTVERLDGLSQRLDTVGASLDRSSQSLEALLARVDRGEGTLGKLSKDPALYDNLNDAARSLKSTSEDFQKLAEDVRKNPKRYLKLSLF